MPGQLVDVDVALADIPDAMVVPRDAVNIGPDGQYVYVVTPDGMRRAARRSRCCSTTAPTTPSRATCKPGDMVITDGQLRVVPGGKVTVARGRARPDGRKARGSGQGARRRAKDV